MPVVSYSLPTRASPSLLWPPGLDDAGGPKPARFIEHADQSSGTRGPAFAYFEEGPDQAIESACRKEELVPEMAPSPTRRTGYPNFLIPIKTQS